MKLTKEHPDKWLMPLRHVDNPALQADEIVTMTLHFVVENKHTHQKMHSIFCVIRKGDKAIARHYVSHEEDGGFCQGHGDDFAEYPIADEEKLKNEVQDHGCMAAAMLASGQEERLFVDENKSVYVVRTRVNNTTNEEFADQLTGATNKDQSDAQQVIKAVLQIGSDTPQARTTAPSIGFGSPTPVLSPFNETGEEKRETNLEKAAKEMELIKKFGKRAMNKLAKDIGYKGEIINKQKTKNNVN